MNLTILREKKAGSRANQHVGLHSDVSANATMVAVHDKEAPVGGSGDNRGANVEQV